jgi:subtilisin family serine protease
VVPRFPAAALAAVTLLLTLLAAPALAAPGARDGVPDRLVVAFDRGADGSDRTEALSDVKATDAHALTALDHTVAVTVADGTAASAVAKLDHADGVAWAQVDRPVRATMSLPAGDLSRGLWQWGLSNIGQHLYAFGVAGVDGDFTSAWERTTGTAQAPIAVIDTGVDFSIADLATNRVAGRDIVAGDDDPSPAPPSSSDPGATSHGTHVAGIAAASMGVNQSGGDITGGAPSAGIMAVRALDATGRGYMSTIADAFAWAADHGARVVNASLSGTGPSQPLANAIASHPNTLFVVAAGNDGTDEDAQPESQRDFPCALDLPNVVCVAAVDSQGRLASFSNYGATTVDVAGPGVDIVSYVAGGQLQWWDGTSMATPFVAAAAELAIARTPTVTAPQLREAIIATAAAHPLSALAGRTTSGGMVDADALVARTAGLPVVAAPVAATKPAPAAATEPAATPQEPVAAPPAESAPSQEPAPTRRSPQLKLAPVKRSGSRLRVSGTLARAWTGTVMVTVCAGRHCTRTRARVTHGRFSAKLAVPRGKRVKVTVAAPAARGYRAISVTRSARS